MFDTGVFDRGVGETLCCLADAESDVGLVELMTDLRRSESVVAERKLAVIAELFVRRTAEIESDGHGHRPRTKWSRPRSVPHSPWGERRQAG
jgi:hypothetical protein